MLSYQHIYHAGNMADVHKHALLAFMLDYLVRKDKPLSYVETHAGRGLYHLGAAEAVKTGEAAQGIGRAEGWFAPDHPYRLRLAEVRAAHGADAYPGSPLLAAQCLRAGDAMHLAELHPREVAALRETMAGRDATIRQVDGAGMALSLCPPVPRRGLLLIDPSYEVKEDYRAMAVLMRRLHRKWPVGTLVLWYPVLAGAPHLPMLRALEEALPEGVRHEVAFAPARPGHRMTGSGLYMMNPPYGTHAEAARLSARFATLARQP